MVSTRTLIYAAIAVSLSLFMFWLLFMTYGTIVLKEFRFETIIAFPVMSILSVINAFICRKFYLYIKSLLGFKFANEQ